MPIILLVKVVEQLFERNNNNSFINSISCRYKDTNWNDYLEGLKIQGFYREYNIHTEGVNQEFINVVFSSALPDELKLGFFNNPIYELHGKTPIELLQSEEGRKQLQLYLIYLCTFTVEKAGM